MYSCTFLGHRDSDESVKKGIKAEVLKLIKRGVRTFYVGNNGNFDRFALSVLKECKKEGEDIEFWVIPAYFPTNKSIDYNYLFPEQLENLHPKYAIDHRNRWLLKNSQFVIFHVIYSFGGAKKYLDLAIRKGNNIIYIP